MKQRSTTPVSKGLVTKSVLVAAAVMMAVATPMSIMPRVSARDYDAEISALQSQVSEFQARAGELQQKANTLQNQLNRLAAEKAQIQAQIDISQAKYEKLVADIKANEIKIAENKDALGMTIADMYVDDSITPLEMLASSNNIGDYVDKQSYQESISDELQSTIDTIRSLKEQLEKDKAAVERVLADQKAQRQSLASKEAQRQKLLSQTKGQEAAYQKLSREKNAQINELQAQQAAYFNSLRSSGTVGSISAGDPNKGGYPAIWANSDYNYPLTDTWGMYSRQCVSYTAWRASQSVHGMPYWGGKGNAWQWAFSGYHDGAGNKVNYNSGYWHNSNADAAGIPNGAAPREGAVAVRDANPAAGDQWGHVAWVEKVSGNQVYISQYNYFNAGGPGWGHYSEMWVDASFFQKYIYFND